MGKYNNTSKRSTPVPIIFLGLFCLSLLLYFLLRNTNMQLLSPKGEIANEEYRLIKFSVFTMLSLGIPTLFLFYYFAWKYREDNNEVTHVSSIKHGKFFVPALWALPFMFVVILGSTMWPAAHKLDQHKAIVSNVKPLTIQVVALRWKWLFIYPEQQLATVNYVQIPVNTPVQFELTADETPMSSFWIPQLGGQLYAMTGHANLINLIADTPGTYTGQSAEINGAGFAGMKFTVHAGSVTDFDTWSKSVKRPDNSLSELEYARLLQPSENDKTNFYATVEQGLYDKVLTKYNASHQHNTELQ